MKIFLTLFLAAFSLLATAQRNKKSVSSHNVYKDLAYAWHPGENGTVDSVRLDLYLPEISDASQEFPLMVFIHGGGFMKGDKSSAEKIAKAFTDSGFVAASINYRLGWGQNDDICDTTGATPKVAFYKALQDTRAAMRFLVGNAEKFHIDTSWIFVQGSSAGGVTSLNLVYFPQDSANKYLPDITDSLGLLDTAGNQYRNEYTIKGVGALWGALLSPDLITAENAVPTIFFHGERDRVVPWDVDHFYKCPDFPIAYGTKPLYKRMTDVGAPAVAIIDPEGGHGIYDIVFREKNIFYFIRRIMDNQIPTKWIVGKKYVWNEESAE